MKLASKILASTVLALSAAATFAGPVVSQTITHNYGSGAGKVAPTYGAGACLNASSVTVMDSTACGANRFADEFGFTGFETVTSFKLTLSYAGTNGFWEDWRVRPSSSAWAANDQVYQDMAWNVFDAKLPALLFDMDNVTGSTTTVFTFTAANLNGNAFGAGTLDDVFSQIVSEGKFQLWFSEEGPFSQSFTLNSASLVVTGTSAVPEPASIALVGLGLVGAFVASRRRKAA